MGKDKTIKPHLILHSQTINKNIINNSAPINSVTDFFLYQNSLRGFNNLLDFFLPILYLRLIEKTP
ncbi:MAG: hypothetical protein CL941_03040 [Desulfobacter sp.]|nr:hypothetical protein [Desulfobacter sp.]